MIKNEKDFPERYFARHIKEGLVSYSEDDVLVNYLVTNEALKKMNSSFEGKPIYVNHVMEVDLDHLREQADGYVVKSFYNEFDGAWWCEIILVSDRAKSAVKDGWAVSNAYLPTELGSGGVYHNISYAKEIKNGKYEHLAIVDNPRYEEAVIMTPQEFKDFNEGKKTEMEKLKNSKENNEMLSEEDKKAIVDSLKNSLADIVKTAVNDKLEEAKQNAKEENHRKVIREIALVSAKAETEFEGGLSEQARKLNALVNELDEDKENSKKNEDEDKKDNSEDEEKENKCKNEDEEEKENSEDEEKENSEDDEKENSEDEDPKAKENSKDYFKALKNAKNKAKLEAQVIQTSSSALQRGKARYGSN